MHWFKSLSVFTVVVLLCLSLVGCSFVLDSFLKTNFSFLHETSEIKAIEIVVIGEVAQIENVSSEPPAAGNKPNFDIVCYVQDIEQFIDDFSKVECFHSSPPRSPILNDVGIKIIYNNDDFDIICSSGQGEYRDGFYYSDTGKFSFDKTQFDELINKYTNDMNKNG